MCSLEYYLYFCMPHWWNYMIIKTHTDKHTYKYILFIFTKDVKFLLQLHLVTRSTSTIKNNHIRNFASAIKVSIIQQIPIYVYVNRFYKSNFVKHFSFSKSLREFYLHFLNLYDLKKVTINKIMVTFIS